ncbi:HupB DNA binding protein HU-beta [Legionella geestiana]|uniref:HupB DNA binding protein HU-beta n=1 Tax=Legionella geestiana TaxID=45065 RepID=A0A0W0U1M8_9GAMM|nr:HU family DNA-binding protein [Legionella geestiana]KTD01986.1 HupB DNA binding protein HU-beta [Legionella geestiana]QBS12030.1 HU family DNA-binding protein [Legionella geestiana]QDQ40360.1 HU family DNA-binding protein [Legionella geestiana]STX53251.1 HupB DNA binding protein HU-beta [Legionella geestiana]
MNKTELVEGIAEAAGISKVAAGKALHSFMEQVVHALKSGTPVSLPGFGTFDVGHRAGRTGRNPRTGEEIKIKPSRVPKFRAGKVLKDAVQG